jgi:hypothetical protein
MSDRRAGQAGASGERGLTLRSLSMMVLVTLLSAVIATLSGVFDSANPLIGSEALAVPAMLVGVPLLLVVALVGIGGRFRLLSRAEMVCVLFAALIATPLMTMGFWRYQLSGLATVVRLSDWTKFEALPESLWPHGENLFRGMLAPGRGLEPRASGGTARVTDSGVALANGAAEASSSVRFRVKLGPEPIAGSAGQPPVLVPGRPYLLTALVRASELGADSSYFVRVYADDKPAFSAEPISSRQEKKPTPLLPDGAVRVGLYPMTLPSDAARGLVFELGLRGKGRAEWRDLRLYDVSAIEAAYKGYRRVSAKEYALLSVADRQGVLVVPDSLFSAKGLAYVAGLSYPIRDWFTPVAVLAAFALLVFAATLGLALLYRKQWLENERFPIPMARPVLALLGVSEADGGLGPRFFRNPWLLGGFAATFAWCSLKVLYGYLPSLPDLRINIGLKSYLPDAFWGRTWDNVEFSVLAVILGVGLLMELNVLLSLVLGFLFFRLQYWFGQAQGLSADQDYPYFSLQLTGAYLMYGALLIFSTRRYLGNALAAVLGKGVRGPETPGQRVGLALFAASLLGFLLWGSWVGVSALGVALLAGHVLLVAWVSQKLRAECGLPYAGFNHPLGGSGNYNAPLEAMLLLPLLGGLSVFGANSVLVMSLVTAVVLPFGFFLVPGLQVELMEVGRRCGVRTSHLMLTALLGVGLAIVVGGWVYLTSLYGFGAVKFPAVSEFSDRVGAFRAYNAEFAAAQSALEQTSAGAAQSSSTLSGGRALALGFGAFGAFATSALRQLFPGFWFHPVGFLVGPTSMMQTVWGSLFVAYVVRLLVLKLGGATTVRSKLIPSAIGIFLGSLAGHALYIVGNAYWFFYGKGAVKFGGML